MASAAKLTIQIETQAGGAVRGLKMVASEGKSAAAAMDKAAARNKAAGKSFDEMNISIKGTKRNIGTLVTAIGAFGAVAAVTGTLAAGTAIALKFSSAIRETSMELGVSTEAVAGWSAAASEAGTDLQSVADASSALGDAVAAAVADPTGDAAAALDRFGLSAEALAAMSPEDRLKAAADAFASVGAGAQKAADAEAVFGSSSGKLAGFLSGGSAALEKGAADAEKFGTALSSVQSDQIADATSSLSKLGEVVTGVAVQVGAELAPYIAAAADYLVEFAANSNLAKDAAAAAGKTAVAAGRFIGDAFDGSRLVVANFTIGLAAIGTTVLPALLPPLRALSSLFDAITGSNLTGDLEASIVSANNNLAAAGNDALAAREAILSAPKSTGDTFADALEGIAKESAAAAKEQGKLTTALQKTGEAGAGAGAMLKGSKIKEYLDGLQASVDGFGQSKADDAAAAVAKLGGGDDAQNQARQSAQRLADLEAAKSVLESVQTPAEKYEERMAELSGLLSRGALSQEAFNEAAKGARRELGEAQKIDPTKRASAAEEGSAEAVKAIRDYRASSAASPAKTAEDKLQKTQDEALKSQRDGVGLLRKIAEGIATPDPIVSLV